MPLYSGMTNCYKKIIKYEGLSGTYKGFLISAVGTIPYLSTSFFIYDILRDYIPKKSTNPNYA